MKILLTTSFYPPYHIGGDAVHVKYLAETLVKEGHEVHVLHSMDAYHLKRKEKRIPEKSEVIVHRLRSSLGILEPILNYSFGTQSYTMNFFKQLIKKEQFDVVHHHNISLLGYNILKKMGDYKNLYTAHDYWLICHKYDLMDGNETCKQRGCFLCCAKQRKVYQFFRYYSKFKESLNDIDTIIAPSQFMADILRKEFDNVRVIHNFIPNPLAKERNKKIRDHFIYASVLTKQKGVMNLIKAVSKTNKRLLLVGTGDLEQDLKKLKLANVKLLGFKSQKELFPLISSAQALIIPSTWPENNPLIALESLSLGTPVIGSDSGGIPEIVEKIDKELVFKKDDIEQLMDIVMNFDRNKYPPKKIQTIYQKHFSKQVFLKNYLKLIK